DKLGVSLRPRLANECALKTVMWDRALANHEAHRVGIVSLARRVSRVGIPASAPARVGYGGASYPVPGVVGSCGRPGTFRTRDAAAGVSFSAGARPDPDAHPPPPTGSPRRRHSSPT